MVVFCYAFFVALWGMRVFDVDEVLLSSDEDNEELLLNI
jgi:hypothetical protein